tara:strand:+ start:8914 stop:9672 length:759 start_codon:yes stop_codon:yes gene_type:complete
MKTEQLKRGEFNPYYPIKDLKMAKDNRDFILNHAINFKNKLTNYGWLMPIIISDNGFVIEGHHRLESAKLLKQKFIPVYIVDWIDTTIPLEHLNCIISLNNANLNWTPLNYLKAFAPYNNDYKLVYNKYLTNLSNITIGNIIKIYFNNNHITNNKNFKIGKSKIYDLNLSDYLLNKVCYLSKNYGKKIVIAYCVREFIRMCLIKTNNNIKTINFLTKQYEKMLKINHPNATSLVEFRPTLELYLNNYRLKIK